MALTASEQEFVDWVINSTPWWFTKNRTNLEDLESMAKIFEAAKQEIKNWFDMTYIKQSVDEPPDWTNQHAIDRGTYRQEGETTVQLRARIFDPQITITPEAIVQYVNTILNAGNLGDCALFETRRDRAFMGAWNTTPLVFGGDVEGTAPDMEFVLPNPVTSFPIFDGTQDNPGLVVSYKITMFGCPTPGNNGTFPVTGVDGDKILYTNASGVGGESPTSHALIPVDRFGNELWARNFAHIGSKTEPTIHYRMAKKRANGFIIIIPHYGAAINPATGLTWTDAEHEALRISILAVVKQRKAAGFTIKVKRRENP